MMLAALAVIGGQEHFRPEPRRERQEIRLQETQIFEERLRSSLRRFRFADCNETDWNHCLFTAVPLDEELLVPCDETVLANESVVSEDGGDRRRSYAIVSVVRVQPVQVAADEASASNDRARSIDFYGVLLFDEPGLKKICLRDEIEVGAQHYSMRFLDESDQFDSLLASAGRFLGRGAERDFLGWIGCLLTGCAERGALAVTVRGGDASLPILFKGSRTVHATDETFRMPRSQLDQISVEYPDGSVKTVAECDRRRLTRYSVAYDCGTK